MLVRFSVEGYEIVTNFHFLIFILKSGFWKQPRNKESTLSGRTAHILC